MIDVLSISESERQKIFARQESHFLDMKSRLIKPAKLTRTISAFANADGGEVYIGIEQETASWKWDGFSSQEDANGHIQIFDQLFPFGADFRYEFLQSDGAPGLVLRVSVLKTRDVKVASDGIPYVRRGAQNRPVTTADELLNLKRAKGIISHEDATITADPAAISNSENVIRFMLEVVPHSEPEAWLKKQRLIVNGMPTAGGVLLFADEPQVFLPKGTVKIYRYKTTDAEGTRDTLAFDPITIEGCIYDQIRSAVDRTVEYTEQIQIMTDDGLQSIQYPRESLHEIITNALLHRDYALHDDVHIRIFDNRIEVESPGRLPAHITPDNILNERFARNAKIVRLINKFPNPPNKDVGEGLNTAFLAMKKLRLRDPQILERENSVLVLIRHETLASPQQAILEYIRENGSINNAAARDVTGIQSEVRVRKLFQELIRAREIEQIPGTARATSAYRIPADRSKPLPADAAR